MHCFRLLDSKFFSSLIKGHTYENKSIILRSLRIKKNWKKLCITILIVLKHIKKAACIIL